MITWRDTYNVGVKQIDDQHQELVQRLNEFMEACTNQKGKEKIQETLGFLKAYTVEHFRDEEKLMSSVKYPELPAHKKEHDDFVRVIDDLLEQVNAQGISILTTIKLNRTLVDWLINHIQRNDGKVGEFIRQQG